MELARRWDATVLSLDDYYRDLSHLEPALRVERNFDHPDALDWGLLFSQLRDLGCGREVRVPLYDFTTHARVGSRTLELTSGRLIVEGVFALYRDELRELLELSVFIDLPPAVRLQRRLERDTRERGRSARSVREQHVLTVEPMFRRYVLPTRERADLVVDGQAPIAETTELVVAAGLAPRVP